MNKIISIEEPEFLLSFDVDWAPDYVIEDVLKILSHYNQKSSWFVTHSTTLWEYLRKEKNLFELGIHPNFLPGSTQGSSIEEVCNYLMEIVPEAKVFRLHAMFQYGELLSQLNRLTQIKVDSSIFLPEISNITCVKHLTPYGSLLRIPIYWVDDYELLKESISNSIFNKLETPGLKVFIFHPIHIYLNSPDFDYYEKNKTDISVSKNKQFSGYGIRNLFIEFLDYLQKRRVETITMERIANEF